MQYQILLQSAVCFEKFASDFFEDTSFTFDLFQAWIGQTRDKLMFDEARTWINSTLEYVQKFDFDIEDEEESRLRSIVSVYEGIRFKYKSLAEQAEKFWNWMERDDYLDAIFSYLKINYQPIEYSELTSKNQLREILENKLHEEAHDFDGNDIIQYRIKKLKATVKSVQNDFASLIPLLDDIQQELNDLKSDLRKEKSFSKEKIFALAFSDFIFVAAGFFDEVVKVLSQHQALEYARVVADVSAKCKRLASDLEQKSGVLVKDIYQETDVVNYSDEEEKKTMLEEAEKGLYWDYYQDQSGEYRTYPRSREWFGDKPNRG